MKCVVGVKRVVDYSVKVQVSADGKTVNTQHLKQSMNPFDEIALEEAVRLKEAGTIDEIVVVTIGQQNSTETLRQALARGADRALLIETEKTYEPLNIAKILKWVVQKEQPSLVLLGKQAIDDDCNQTGQMLAALLGWPQGTFASKLELTASNAQVLREIDAGLERIQLSLPCVVTADLRLNEPRYLSLPNIMRAKSKPIEQCLLKDLSIDLKNHLERLELQQTTSKRRGIKVESVQELLKHLTHEIKLD